MCIRDRLAWAKKCAEVYLEDYNINVEALEKVQPKDLTASEIFVQLGTTWPVSYTHLSGGYDKVGAGNEQSEEQSAGDRESGGHLRLDYYDRRDVYKRQALNTPLR